MDAPSLIAAHPLGREAIRSGSKAVAIRADQPDKWGKQDKLDKASPMDKARRASSPASSPVARVPSIPPAPVLWAQADPALGQASGRVPAGLLAARVPEDLALPAE